MSAESKKVKSEYLKDLSPGSPRVVYTQAPVVLGRVLEAVDGFWRVRMGRAERLIAHDETVDPSLLVEAIASGARVVIDTLDESPVIVGVLTTSRSLTIDRNGDVNASVRSFTVSAEDEVLVKTKAAFVQLKAGEMELYANRIVTRARELARILGRMIKLN